MPLPPLVDPEDLQERYPELPEARLEGAVSAASALARAYTRKPRGWVDEDDELTEVPDPVVEAVMLIARRVALMPESGVDQESAGPFSVKRDSSMWLSTAEKVLLDSVMSSVSSMTVQGPVPNARLSNCIPVGDGTTDWVPWDDE